MAIWSANFAALSCDNFFECHHGAELELRPSGHARQLACSGKTTPQRSKAGSSRATHSDARRKTPIQASRKCRRLNFLAFI